MTNRKVGFRSLALLSAVAFCVIAGCNGEDKPASAGAITGKVTLDGQPVESGRVSLISGEGYSVTMDLQPGGTFELAKAPPPGQYRVTVSPPEPVPGETPTSESNIPQGYHQGSTSGLTVTLTDEPNNLTVELDSSGPSGGGA